MKSFYSPAVESPLRASAGTSASVVPLFGPRAHARGRIATYDAPAAAPRIEDIGSCPVPAFIETLSSRVYELAQSQGGSVPYTVIRELAENLIHADFDEPVVSILDGGSTIRFADQGPGIQDKETALLPGFTTARGEMKCYIRGVGSGLPLVREFLVHSGGSLVLEDNLGRGSVVTIFSRREPVHHARPSSPPTPLKRTSVSDVFYSEQESFSEASLEPATAEPSLSTRQKLVLALVLESGLAGPSLVAKELGVALSTAYRDLSLLEEAGLIVSDSGKRTLTPVGLSYLGNISNTV